MKAAPLYGLLEELAEAITGTGAGYTGLPATVVGIVVGELSCEERTNWLVLGSTSNFPPKELICSASSTEIVPSKSLLLIAANLRLKDFPPAMDLVVFPAGLS